MVPSNLPVETVITVFAEVLNVQIIWQIEKITGGGKEDELENNTFTGL